ncbi:MAG TPA: hypothetical protein PLR41_00625 [Alphaproteobacteria bacterium]|nr:hypothetical protein [Alphaproteobacteria bacterium]
MRQHRSARHMAHANRRIAAAVLMLGLFLQALSPYLPMPAMGGGTSWDMTGAALSGTAVAWLPICLSPRDDGDAGAPTPGAPHPGDCAVCLVMQQAGATLAPAAFDLPVPHVSLRAEATPRQQLPRAAPSDEGFSSRAPPRLA